MIRSEVSEVRATVPAKVAEYLLNNMRAQLVEMENQHGPVSQSWGSRACLIKTFQ